MSQLIGPKTAISPEEVKQLAEGELRMMEILGVQPAELKVKMDEALEHVQAGRYSEARVIFKGLEAMDRRNPLFPAALGSMEILLKNYAGTVEYAKKAIECGKDFVQAYYLLGEAQAQMKNVPEAMAAFEKAFELAPQDQSRDARRCRAIYSGLGGNRSTLESQTGKTGPKNPGTERQSVGSVSKKPTRKPQPVPLGSGQARGPVARANRSAPQPVFGGRQKPRPVVFSGRGAAAPMRPTPVAPARSISVSPPRSTPSASPKPSPVGRPTPRPLTRGATPAPRPITRGTPSAPAPRPLAGGAPRPVPLGRGAFTPAMLSRAGRAT